jgi:hypothetical protein
VIFGGFQFPEVRKKIGETFTFSMLGFQSVIMKIEKVE